MLWSFDTETHLAQPGLAAPPIVCASVADENAAHVLSATEALRWLHERLARGDELVGCNLVYDLGVACAADRTLIDPVFAALEAGLLHDVGIREALIDIAKGTLLDKGDEGLGMRYGMRELSKRYFNEDISEEKNGPDSWRRRFATLEQIPIEQWPWAAKRYVLRDASKPREIYLAQQGGANLHDEFRQMRAAWALHLMSVWGLRTDRARVEKLRVEVEAEWESSRVELQKVGIFRADLTKDTKRLGELVSAAYDGQPPMTPSGKVATDRDTLIESGDPVLKKLGTSGKNDKRKTTYLPQLEEGLECPWCAQFNVLVATGRVSSDAQQLPQKGGIRECFCPRCGRCFCSIDYGGLELRTMSQRAIWEVGYSYMAEVLNAGKDPHLLVAAQFMGATYEALLPRKKEEDVDRFRKLAKIFNFGKGGGMGAGAMAYNARSKDDVRFCLTTGIAQQCGIEKRKVWVQGKQKSVCAACIEVSRKLGNSWLAAWPEQAELFRRAGVATNGGYADVEVPVSKRVRGQCGYTQWLNTPFQGLGADLVKDAMWRVSREMHTDRRSALWNQHLLLNVHDELIAEFDLDVAPEAADRMGKIMRDTACEWLPDLGPSVEADPAISLVLSKSMATVRDASGRLQLWEPKKAA